MQMNTSTSKLAPPQKVAGPLSSRAYSDSTPFELLARSEIVMISHVLMADEAGFTCRAGYARDQGVREIMIAPGNHLEAVFGSIVKSQGTEKDLIPTRHNGRIT